MLCSMCVREVLCVFSFIVCFPLEKKHVQVSAAAKTLRTRNALSASPMRLKRWLGSSLLISEVYETGSVKPRGAG